MAGEGEDQRGACRRYCEAAAKVGTVALCVLRHEKLLNKWDEFLAQSPRKWGEIGHALVEPPELIRCRAMGLTRTWPVDEPVAAKHVRGLVGSLCRKVPRASAKKFSPGGQR